MILRHAENVIFADLVYINPDTGDVSAEGNVLAVFNNSRIYTEKIYYNTKKQDAYCKTADVISPPWIIRCESMVRQDDTTELKKPVFTTCDNEKPHYRMEASVITLYGKKRIEAWHIAVYLGTIPVMYFPYFSQSLEGNKDPFQFQLKWNDENGWYTNMKYYFFTRLFDVFSTDGQVGLDYYEKKGPAFNLDLNYNFGADSTGSFAGSYLQEKNTNKQRWGINFIHNQTFAQNIRAGITARSSSDSLLDKQSVSEGEYDMFKHELSGSFTGTFFGNHTIGLDVNDTEQLDTTDPDNPQYYTYSRLLPKLTYSMPSTQLFPYFYYNHSVNLNRSYNCVTCTAGSDIVYRDVGSFAPAVRVNTPKMIFATLSANAGLNSAWTINNEKTDGWGEFLHSLNTSETLQLDILPRGMMQGSLVHSYGKRLNKIGGLEHDGITASMLSSSLSGGVGTFSYTAGLTYNMLPNRAELATHEDIDRFSFLNLSGNFRADVYYMTASTAYSLYSGQMKNAALNLSIVDNSPKQLWSASAKADFSNNRIDSSGHPVTVDLIDDALTFSTAFSFGFTPDFRVSVYRSYDLMQKTLVSHSYALIWYIHCWQADLSWSKRQDNAEEIFFSIAISAVPEFRMSKPSSAMPDQFKNLENLIPIQ